MNRRTFFKRTGGMIAGGSTLVVLNHLMKTFSFSGKEFLLRRTNYGMGTFITITVIGENEKHASDSIEHAFRVLREVEEEMTVFNSTSTVSKINRMAGEREVAIGTRLFTVFDKAKEIHNLSNEAMDITVGPVMEKWGFWTHPLQQIPTDREIRVITENVGMEKLIINKFSAGLTKSGAKIDLGCIAKGFGVDEAIQALKSNGIESAVVNAGGDLYALGSYPDEDGWLIGITHPLNPENTIVNMKVKNGAVATSGNYQNYISVNNIKYGHIVDPYQGIPTSSREVLSSTIIGTSAMECDGFATACFVQGIEQGIKTAADNNLKYIFIGNYYGGVSVKYSDDLLIIT